ncbi:hypothetical protein BDK51DRAFT_30327, partial [Blyttiomyces helicus]
PTSVDEYGWSYNSASPKQGRVQVWIVAGEGHVYVNGMHLSKFGLWVGVGRMSGALSVAIAHAIALHDPYARSGVASFNLHFMETLTMTVRIPIPSSPPKIGMVKLGYRHKERKRTPSRHPGLLNAQAVQLHVDPKILTGKL